MYNFDYSKHRICLSIEFDSEVPTTSTRKYNQRNLLVHNHVDHEHLWMQRFFPKTHTHYVLYLLFSDVISQETAEYQASEAAKKNLAYF